MWAIPLAVGIVAGLFLGLGYALGTHGGADQPVAQNVEPAPAPESPIKTASASLPLPEAVTPVITQAFNPADVEEAPKALKPTAAKPAVRAADSIDYFAEPKAAKRKPKPQSRLQYPNWAMYESARVSIPPPHVLAMNPYREHSPTYVYLMGIEHPYLSDVSTVWEKNNNPYGPGPRMEFTGE